MPASSTLTALSMAVLALSAAILCTVTLLREHRRLLSRQRQLEDQANSLEDAVRMIEASLTELRSALPGRSIEDAASLPSGADLDAPAAETNRLEIAHEAQPEVSPEIQVAIAVAAAVAVGPNVRVRGARLVKNRDDASPWSQQGRVFVQASHNLRRARVAERVSE